MVHEAQVRKAVIARRHGAVMVLVYDGDGCDGGY
jgi:hypothetical protein